MANSVKRAAVDSGVGDRLGAKVRMLRRREGLSQVQLAERLGVSASYLNLIESNKRPLPAALLIKLAQLFEVDVGSFAADEDARLVADLTEAFADPLFEDVDITSVDVREVAAASPTAARAILTLYRAYQEARATSDNLSSRLTDGEIAGVDRLHMPNEEVSDLIQQRMNYFPELEEGAEELCARAKLTTEDLYPGLIRWLEKQGISVKIARWGSEPGTLRRFDDGSRALYATDASNYRQVPIGVVANDALSS